MKHLTQLPGKGQFKEQQTSSILYISVSISEVPARVYTHIYIYAYTYTYLGCIEIHSYPQHEQQVNHNRNDTRTHTKTSDINAAVVTNYVISRILVFFFFNPRKTRPFFFSTKGKSEKRYEILG